MYHGGTDPMGELSTMQESQITGYPNDMPTRTYDFHAPLGEAGQPRPHYHGIRGLAALMAQWGSWLAPLPSFKPSRRPSGPTDTATLRVAVRSDGTAGIIFLNNRNTHVNMSEQAGVRLTVVPAGGGAPLSIPLPSSPAPTLPAGAWAAWPFGLPLPNAALAYALATPLTLLPGGASGPTAVFAQAPGVPAEFAFNATSPSGRPLRWSACGGACSTEGGLLLARGVPPGLGAALTLSFADGAGGAALGVLLLDARTAARAWVTPLAGAPTLLLSDANTSFLLAPTSQELEVHTEGLGGEVALWALPAPAALAGPGGAPLAPTPDGLFSRYAFPAPAPALTATATLLSGGGPARVIPKGPKGNAWAPSADGALGEFADAAVWALALEGAIGDGVDVRLRVRYNGDCARLYEGASVDRRDLVMDHFFNGHPMELPLTRAGFNASSTFTLRVLPLAKNAAPGAPFPWGPVGFEVPPAFNSTGVALGLLSVEAVHTWRTTLVVSSA
jgi:beta-galactosidase